MGSVTAWLGCAVASLLIAPTAVGAECNVELTQHTLDYGQMRQPAGPVRPYVKLEARVVQVMVACGGAQRLGVRFRGAPERGGLRFSEFGRLAMRVRDAQVDGQSVPFFRAARQGRSAGVEPALGVAPGDAVYSTQAGEVLTFVLEVEPRLQRAAWRTSDLRTIEARLVIDGYAH